MDRKEFYLFFVYCLHYLIFVTLHVFKKINSEKKEEEEEESLEHFN